MQVACAFFFFVLSTMKELPYGEIFNFIAEKESFLFDCFIELS